MTTDLQTFSVYRKNGDVWEFWMNARGKSEKQVRHAVWWKNKGHVEKESIRVKKQGATP